MTGTRLQVATPAGECLGHRVAPAIPTPHSKALHCSWWKKRTSAHRTKPGSEQRRGWPGPAHILRAGCGSSGLYMEGHGRRIMSSRSTCYTVSPWLRKAPCSTGAGAQLAQCWPSSREARAPPPAPDGTGMVSALCNVSIQEADAGDSLMAIQQIQSQPGLHETLSPKKRNKRLFWIS